MSVPVKFDWQQAFQAMRKRACRNAELCNDPGIREMWYDIAAHWEYLAHFQGERCACGHPALGATYHSDGSRVAYCAQHMRQVIAAEMVSLNSKKPH